MSNRGVSAEAESDPVEVLADVLAAAGTTRMFGLPGGGPNLALIGAAERRGIGFVLAHGETEAAIMAATYGLLAGEAGAVLATRGPGATSLANGVAQATLDRFPLVAITDTVPATQATRVSHQRLDQRAMMAPITKAGITVGPTTPAASVTELVARARTWPMGAVHIDLDSTWYGGSTVPASGASPPSRASEAELDRALELVAAATQPLVIAGAEAAALGPGFGQLLLDLGIPVLTTYQAVGVVPTDHELNAGLFTNGELERPAIEAADLIITVGLDLVEPIPAPWDYPQPVVRLSAVRQSDPYLPATVDAVGDLMGSLAHLANRLGPRVAPTPGRLLREQSRARIRTCDVAGPGLLGPIELVDAVVAAAPGDATFTVDAGAHFLAAMPLVQANEPHRVLISNGLATMGFALPAAIGAALARPEQPVVALIGDGGLSMVLAELETVARLDLPVTVIVFNDAALSLIEIKQHDGQGGSNAVRYRPVDFAGIANASGVSGSVVESSGKLSDHLRRGWSTPRLLDVRLDPGAYPALIAATRG